MSVKRIMLGKKVRHLITHMIISDGPVGIHMKSYNSKLSIENIDILTKTHRCT